ncbi:MSC_0882 family membrane protein [Mycoplasmopsis glycophila]|uniref:Uncharacterized protein n=1 Tax=Mycoplasmopsis glycophila TaxID=171285 RepID=A0A449AU89_9BACT|nr:hypothetical protein [Mycoplasmopsis glycophila]VEU70056.1 Uncharacterised protein [Mycoplasmopsis glycophila]
MHDNNDFKPKNTEGSLNFRNATAPIGLNEHKPTRIYEESRDGLNPALLSILRKERFIRVLGSLFFGIIALLATIALIIVGVKYKANAIGWYILLGAILLISVPLLVKNLITYTAINKTEKQFRYNQRTGDAASHAMFAEMLKSLVMKSLRITWIYLFFVTYFGLLLLITLALWKINGGVWSIGHAPEENAGVSSFYLNVNWDDVLNKMYGNVKSFLSIGLITILGTTIVYLFVILYDKKRKMDLQSQLGSDFATILADINASKRSENKAWLRAYIIIFVLVVLMPLAVFAYLLYKKFIRRAK